MRLLWFASRRKASVEGTIARFTERLVRLLIHGARRFSAGNMHFARVSRQRSWRFTNGVDAAGRIRWPETSVRTVTDREEAPCRRVGFAHSGLLHVRTWEFHSVTAAKGTTYWSFSIRSNVSMLKVLFVRIYDFLLQYGISDIRRREFLWREPCETWILLTSFIIVK